MIGPPPPDDGQPHDGILRGDEKYLLTQDREFVGWMLKLFDVIEHMHKLWGRKTISFADYYRPLEILKPMLDAGFIEKLKTAEVQAWDWLRRLEREGMLIEFQ